MNMWEEAPKASLFGIQVYSFGLYCAIGALAAAAAICILSCVSGRKKGTGVMLASLSILCGIGGARMFFCLLKAPGTGAVRFSWWFNITSGGFSLFGMILGVFFAAWICAKMTGEKSASLLDTVSCAIPLAIAAERIGERLFDGFDVSRTVKGAFPAGTFLAVENTFYGTSSLATWLVSAILAIVLFLFLTFRLLKKDQQEGDQWIVFLMMCGAGGVILESLRYDYHLEYSFVYFQQIIAALMLLWGLILAGRRWKRKGLFIISVCSFVIAAAICGGVEFALDRMNINHILLYFIMTAALAVPVTLGMILLSGRSGKGTEST